MVEEAARELQLDEDCLLVLDFWNTTSSLPVGKSEPLRSTLLLENPDLLLQVLDHGLLLPAHPPGKLDQNQFECVHRRKLVESAAGTQSKIRVSEAAPTA